MKLNCDELASEDIQEITMEMMRVLNRETDVTASLAKESAQREPGVMPSLWGSLRSQR
ncbi:hypothetical protein QUF90_26745 [Desulfococcaceae bacterium HSG9]|nr:hypothetical protein [Desulfococcaceae bacterium HSG9]